MTNYEKIKSLSFDEMRKFLKNNFSFSCLKCPYGDDCSVIGHPVDKCNKALKDWLLESEED